MRILRLILLFLHDPDGDELSFTLTSTPTGGAYVGGTYIPGSNFNGSDSFTFTASDGEFTSNEATVSITVNSVNDVPLAIGDSYSVDEDGALNVEAPGIAENDSDVDGDALTVILASDVENGTLQLSGDGSFVYVPNADFNGTDGFTYTAFDGATASNDATVSIEVNSVNDAPVANDDDVSTDEDEAVSGNVLGNDSDVDGDELSANLLEGPTSGSLEFNGDGSYIYTPGADFNGSDSFSYEADDGVEEVPEGCPEGYAACADGEQCIPTGYWCDGSSDNGNGPWPADCVDGSDEVIEECCDSGYNAYDDGFCSGEEPEGGEQACIDAGGHYCGDDESNWTIYSPQGCVPENYICDNFVDCVDASDEADCDSGDSLPGSNRPAKTHVFVPVNRDVSSAATVSITVNSVNDAPVADAGADQNHTITPTADGASVTLDGSGSSDIDSENLMYSWGNYCESMSPTCTATLAPGTHTITLTVSDGDLSDTDDVTVTVIQMQTYWQSPTPTDQYHLVLLGDVAVSQTSLEVGIDEIGVFDGDLLVGMVVYNGVNGQQMLAWQDDPMTNEVDGFTAGNAISFKYYDASDVDDFGVGAILDPVTATFIDFAGFDASGTFSEGGISAVDLNTNRAPYFVSTPQLTANENVAYEYVPVVEDLDIELYSDEVTITANTLPSWLSFDGETLSGTPTNIDLGVHDVSLTVTDIAGLSEDQEFVIEVVFNNELDAGWSWKGFPVLPSGSMSADAFFGPVAESVIIVMSHMDGAMVSMDGALTGGDFTISDSDGYIIKMSDAGSFTHSGQHRIAPDQALTLEESWNWVGYYGLGSPAADAAFGDILDEMVVAMSRDGALLNTPWGLLNGIGNMNFTDGYLVKMNAGGELTWPSGSGSRSIAAAMDVTPTQAPSYFTPTKTLTYHLINVRWEDHSELSYGDELAVFNDEVCVGSVVYNGKDVQQILAWEATNGTSQDGFHSGESMRFVHWNGSEEKELSSEIAFVDFNGWSTSNTFQSEGMSGVNVAMGTMAASESQFLPEKIQLLGNYPNPFNPYTTIKYELTHDAHVSLVIYNSLGEMVQELVNGTVQPGSHNAVWNGESMTRSSVPSGVYIYQLQVDGVISGTRKMVLVK